MKEKIKEIKGEIDVWSAHGVAISRTANFVSSVPFCAENLKSPVC